LKEIGAAGHPLLTVYNKADLLDPGMQPVDTGILVSAVSGEGLDHLVEQIVEHVSPVRV
jgi:50S ribosomal subunit-associated GTPase HflX